MPDHEADCRVLVMAREIVLEINAWKRTMTRVVAVKGLVPVQEVRLCQQARVDVAVAEIYYHLQFLVDMWDFNACPVSQCTPENEQLSGCEDDVAPFERRTITGFKVELSGYLTPPVLEEGNAVICNQTINVP